MIKELFLVRHGVCTGNVADRASSKGDHSYFTDDFMTQSSDSWPLTEEGFRQSKCAGEKISELVSSVDFLMCSGVLRATQTAEAMKLVGCARRYEPLLRERNWGGVENLPYDKRNKIFSSRSISPVEDSIDWSPPGGESMKFVIDRMKFYLHRSNLIYANKCVVAVTHGGPIQAMRVIHNKVDEVSYTSFIGGNNYIRNCQIVHYSGRSGNLFANERVYYMDSKGGWELHETRVG